MSTHKQARLLDVPIPTKATGKTVDSLLISRNKREDILRLFDGDLPMSIMKAQRKTRGEADLAAGTYAASSNIYKEGNEVAPALEHAFETSGRSVRGGDHHSLGTFGVSGQGAAGGALSAFPQNIGNTVVRLYSAPGELVVDPFAGHNSRMELCIRNGRRYVGYDISHAFMEFNRERAELLRTEYRADITLYEADSRYMQHTVAGVGDFTLTSPPYYNIEYYGDEPQQLGKAPTYSAFLDEMCKVARANYRTLRCGAFCVWFVNDFRQNGKFYLYHADTAALLQSVGFVMHDIMVVDLGYPIKAAFASQIVEQRVLPKRHEYGIIVRKP